MKQIANGSQSYEYYITATSRLVDQVRIGRVFMNELFNWGTYLVDFCEGDISF